MEKGTPSIYYKDSFNLLYCHRFLSTRWINHINKSKRIQLEENIGKWDREDEIYPTEQDERIMEEFENVQKELKRLSTTRLFPQAQLFSMYYMSDDNMIEISNKIGICKSTTFNSIKRIRDYLKETIKNPFNEE
jgi:DNA-directed RNA polymerase specialized sigma24 family protein